MKITLEVEVEMTVEQVAEYAAEYCLPVYLVPDDVRSYVRSSLEEAAKSLYWTAAVA